MTVTHRAQIEAQACQQGLDQAGQLLAVLQGAGRMEGDAASLAGYVQLGDILRCQNLAEVAGQRRDPGRLDRVCRVIP